MNFVNNDDGSFDTPAGRVALYLRDQRTGYVYSARLFAQRLLTPEERRRHVGTTASPADLCGVALPVPGNDSLPIRYPIGH